MTEVETRISLMLIVRDAETTIERCLLSALPYVDEIVIGFAGESRDDTVSLVREVALSVPDFEGEWKELHLPWEDDFSKARNAVLDKVTSEWAIWLDADDELVGGEHLRGLIGRAPDDLNAFFLPYDYERDEAGNVITRQVRERVIRHPLRWRWTGAVHEILALDPEVPLGVGHDPRVKVVHQYDRPRDKGDRNLRLLYAELARTEPEPPPRTLMYLGRENASRGNHREALLHFRRYLSLAVSDQESAQTAHWMAGSMRALGDPDGAEKAELESIRRAPDWPDAYFGLAENAYLRRDWKGVIEWTKAGQTKPQPTTWLITNDLDYGYRPLYHLGHSYLNLYHETGAKGALDAAWEALTAAAADVPYDQALADTLRRMADERDASGVLTAFLRIYEQLARHDEWLKARELFRVVPKVLEQHPAIMDANLRTQASTAHVEDPQVMVEFYRDNPGWAPMSEETMLSEGWLDHPRMRFARQSICPAPAYVLDLGSSDGFISLPLAREGYIVMGYDLDPRCVKLANERAEKWDLRANYFVGSIDEMLSAAPDIRLDAALVFEVLEHLADPAAFLDKVDPHVRRVLVTTPYLAWEGGRMSPEQWQKVEPKGHLRIFDLLDMHALLAPRGRIIDLYREPWSSGSSWIFASYDPGVESHRSVAFLAPGTPEPWSPRQIATKGLGGSETALVEVASKLGWQHHAAVTVFTNTDDSGYHDTVRYQQVDEFIPEVSYDTLVAWRFPEAADLPLRAHDLILWMHDTDAGDRLTPARAARFRRIVVLTEWHRDHMLKTYPFLDPERLVIIGNGVDFERFREPAEVEREPYRVIYTSSPDRGLDTLLERIWPSIVERVPEAELHIYYGWDTFDVVAQVRPHLLEFRERVAKALLTSRNVVNHGRVDQATLARELRRATVWLYPTYFTETFCISAVEAQLAGVIPVTNSLAALGEVVKSGVILEPGLSDERIEDYIEATVNLLTTGPDSVLRSPLHEGVKEHVLEGTAVGWDEITHQWAVLMEDAPTVSRQ